jgi:hypothetical protein
MKRVKDRDVRFVRACLHGRLREIAKAALPYFVLDPFGRTLPALLQAAFNEAMHRRFAPRYTHGDVVRFVATARGRYRNSDLDPLLAERVVLHAIGGEVVVGSRGWIRRMLVRERLLRVQVKELGLDDNGIDELLDQGRVRANEWFS